MEIERVDVNALVFDPVNARTHGKRNIDAIKGSLAKFGQQKPIVVDANNVVIAGNGTLEAAKDLGWADLAVHRTTLSGTEAIAFSLADNKTAALAEWDEDILSTHLTSLYQDGWDIEEIGFDADDLDLDHEPSDGLTDPDDVPEVEQNKFKVERGQVWLLGEHRLLCGDSTAQQEVEKLMDGAKADMVFTDPPYGMRLDADFSDMPSAKGTTSKAYKNVEGDHEDYDPVGLLEMFDYVKEIFLWGADYYAERIPNKNDGSWVVWDKRKEGGTDKLFGSSFELCWSKSRHKRDIARIMWAGYFGMGADDTKKRVHPTQKPAILAEWFFERWGKSGDLVIDLFLGSGSTLIACEKTNRKCYGMEIDPHYCSVIIERWQQFTGKEAKLG